MFLLSFDYRIIWLSLQNCFGKLYKDNPRRIAQDLNWYCHLILISDVMQNQISFMCTENHHSHHCLHHQVVLTEMIPLTSSLAIYPYSLSLLASSLDSIQCPYRVDQYKFLLVVKHWCVHELESIIKCIVPYFISCSSYLNWLWDERQVVLQLLFCEVQHPCVVAI